MRVMRWSIGVLVVSLMALAPSMVSAQADASVRQVVAEIQRMRAEAGLPAFIEDEALQRAASRQSAEMADSGRLTHVSPRTGNPSTRVADEGLHPQRVAENVARGSSLSSAQASIVSSQAHRAQLLDAELTHLGVAAAVSADGSVYLTEVMARLPVLEVPTATPPAPSALPPPAVDPAPAQPAASQIAPAQSSPAQALAPPITAPTPGARQVAGYWVLSRGHWYYYPLPP
ncbi:MAG: CAP domain-containing protein, partial [Deltaproteobacteria bacterium]|nr:CAP domain-containing protein [Deltaproteobacteria bacterium]